MIEDITQQIIQKLLIELKKPNNIDQLKAYLLEPIIQYVMNRIYPYIIGSAVVFILIVIFSIMTLMLIVYDIRSKKPKGSNLIIKGI